MFRLTSCYLSRFRQVFFEATGHAIRKQTLGQVKLNLRQLLICTMPKSATVYLHTTNAENSRETEREGRGNYFDISSTAFMTSAELVSSTCPPNTISSNTACICNM